MPDTALDHVLLQLETGNAVHEQSAAPVIGVVHRDLIALAAQLLGGGKAARPGPDDAGRLRALARRLDRLDPAFGPGRVGDVFLDRADRHRAVAGLFDRADALAEAVLRADAAANLRHVVGGGGDAPGLFHAVFGGKLQPVRDIVLQGAALLAEGHAALRAASGLNLGRFLGEVCIDFPEVIRTRRRRPLRRHGPGDFRELQHLLGHRGALRSPRPLRASPAFRAACCAQQYGYLIHNIKLIYIQCFFTPSALEGFHVRKNTYHFG